MQNLNVTPVAGLTDIFGKGKVKTLGTQGAKVNLQMITGSEIERLAHFLKGNLKNDIMIKRSGTGVVVIADTHQA